MRTVRGRCTGQERVEMESEEQRPVFTTGKLKKMGYAYIQGAIAVGEP